MKKTNALRSIWYRLSSEQRFLLRKLYYWPTDLLDRITGKTHKYVPPRGAIYTGSPTCAVNYIAQGQKQLELLKRYIDLQPEDKILDIGSGVGRTAIALSAYLNSQGIYRGFDVVKQGVDWCNRGLGRDFKNFNFTYVALSNDLYNTSNLKASEFDFPYVEATFNKVFSFSVFTHMTIVEIQHYFNQIAKVLKTDGLAFSTFFLYNDETEEKIASLEDFAFKFKREGYRLMSNNAVSGNIAIHEETLMSMLQNANLKCVKMVDGSWKAKRSPDDDRDYQDIVVFKKSDVT